MTCFWEILLLSLNIFGFAISNPTNDTLKQEVNVLQIIPTNSTSNVGVASNTTSNPTSTDNNNTVHIAHVNHTEGDDIHDKGWEYENRTVVDTRRILYGRKVAVGKRPYMVYLQLTMESAKAHKYRGWLCGGVIVHKYYVLTSAACVEDADHFYVVSGTTQFIDSFDYKTDECVCKHRRRVIWKCIPKNYKFDFQDSIKWSANDIAIVKVDKPFKFNVIEKGCEFATDIINYNNISRELEQAGTKGWIAGWGSVGNFREGVYRRSEQYIPENAKWLQEAKVCIMDNEQCAKKWAQKFRSIITQYMICTKDVAKRLSEICDKKYANCTDVENSRKSIGPEIAEDVSPKTFNVDLGRHLKDPDDYTARRSSLQGGFCENDHGGPLIVKYKGKERVIGVISACKIDPKTHSCHGPFLYTSIFKNRQFISCSIYKDTEESCRRVFRTGITHEEWNVNWKNVDEENTNDKYEKAEGSDSSDDDKDALRQPSFKENNSANKKTVQSKYESSDYSGFPDDPNDDRIDSPIDKSKGIEEKSEKTKTRKSKHRKHKSKKDKQDNAGERKKRGSGNKDAVSYESSKDEDVNDPEE